MSAETKESEIELPCGHSKEFLVYIQYPYDHPNHYDGASEITCTECKRRWGRFTGRELKEGESEAREAQWLR